MIFMACPITVKRGAAAGTSLGFLVGYILSFGVVNVGSNKKINQDLCLYPLEAGLASARSH